MKKTDINSKKGFTIIEVVLVLAIAGLIFLMVFVAYPALRRNQSDTARRNDLSRFISQLAQYKSNNRKTPQNLTDIVNFVNGYLDGDVKAASDNTKTEDAKTKSISGFQDPDGEPYMVIAPEEYSSQNPMATLTDVNHVIYYYKKARCEGENLKTSPGKNDIAIVYRMENGIYCQSNAE